MASTIADYYTFTAPTDGVVSATISGAGADVTVRLLNFAGGEIAQATTDASGNATVSLSNAVRSEAYIFEVSGLNAGPYTLATDFSAQNLTDSLSNPVNVSLPLLLESLTLDQTTNPSDFYRIVAPDNATLVVNTSLVTGDFNLRVYDSLGNLIKEAATVGPTAEGTSLTVTAGEAYVIEVVARDATVTGNIQLTLEDVDDTGDNGSIATAQQITVSTTGSTDLSGDVGIDPNFADYYSFTVDTAGDVTISLTV